jgi:hypothetical protein
LVRRRHALADHISGYHGAGGVQQAFTARRGGVLAQHKKNVAQKSWPEKPQPKKRSRKNGGPVDAGPPNIAKI